MTLFTAIRSAQLEGVSAEDITDVVSSNKTFSLGFVSFISQMGFSGKTENRAWNCLTFECDSITSCKGYEGSSTPTSGDGVAVTFLKEIAKYKLFIRLLEISPISPLTFFLPLLQVPMNQ